MIEIMIFEIVKETLKKRQTFQYLYFHIIVYLDYQRLKQ